MDIVKNASGTVTQVGVKDNSGTASFMVALRYILSAVGASLATQGWLDADTIEAISGAILTIVPALYGIWKTWQRKKALIAVAQGAHARIVTPNK